MVMICNFLSVSVTSVELILLPLAKVSCLVTCKFADLPLILVDWSVSDLTVLAGDRAGF